MVKKLTNEIVDQRLLDNNRTIKRIGSVINSQSKVDFECLICQHQWKAILNNILSKNRGCPSCAGNIPLTNKIIDERLLGRGIKRIGNYINAHTKINFECDTCHHVWKTSINSVIYPKNGCPNCAGLARLTNEIIDSRIGNRPIKRIGNYISANSKLEFQCLKPECMYIWSALPPSIHTRGYGCPKCGGTLKLNNEIVDSKLIGRDIKRLGDYIDSETKIDLLCLISECRHTWKAKPDGLLNNNRGCPNCANNVKFTNEIIDKKLEGRSIVRVDDYTGISNVARWKCVKDDCGYIWSTTAGSLLHNNTGCPNCVGLAKLTNEIIDLRLSGRGVKRIGNYINGKSEIKFQCLNENCLTAWEALPYNIIYGGGCPVCIYKNEKIIFLFLKENNINFEYQKNIKSINNDEEKKYRIDFYLPDRNLYIEYNGAQHYKPVRFNGISEERARINFESQKVRDQYVRNFIIKYGGELIEINGLIFSGIKLVEYLNKLMLSDKLKERIG